MDKKLLLLAALVGGAGATLTLILAAYTLTGPLGDWLEAHELDRGSSLAGSNSD